jgi:hypothetical protein
LIFNHADLLSIAGAASPGEVVRLRRGLGRQAAFQRAEQLAGSRLIPAWRARLPDGDRGARLGYILDLAAEATDVQAAERLIRDGRRSTDPAQHASRLRAALALWRGRPLTDVAGLSWLDRQADRLANLRVEAVLSLVEAASGRSYPLRDRDHLARRLRDPDARMMPF